MVTLTYPTVAVDCFGDTSRARVFNGFRQGSEVDGLSVDLISAAGGGTLTGAGTSTFPSSVATKGVAAETESTISMASS